MVSIEDLSNIVTKGHVRIFREDTKEMLFEEDNVITLTVKPLFARLMANSQEPAFGVWGLALGSGDNQWTVPPGETQTQTQMMTQIVRVPLSAVQFVDSNYNPLTTFSTSSNGYDVLVDFQTQLNSASIPALNGVAIREMGLIGGGTSTWGSNASSEMAATAPWWDPTTMLAASVILVNYKQLPPLILPSGVDIIISWVIRF